MPDEKYPGTTSCTSVTRHQNASSSSAPASNKNAAIECIDCTYPTSGACDANANNTRRNAFHATPPGVKSNSSNAPPTRGRSFSICAHTSSACVSSLRSSTSAWKCPVNSRLDVDAPHARGHCSARDAPCGVWRQRSIARGGGGDVPGVLAQAPPEAVIVRGQFAIDGGDGRARGGAVDVIERTRSIAVLPTRHDGGVADVHGKTRSRGWGRRGRKGANGGVGREYDADGRR
mmetsp:Transcript_343/g.1068  ORF Transcript_343/g.1068 Transcript_343/m.1068 type:complete len:232 (-) Transcript_343:88-783(-)